MKKKDKDDTSIDKRSTVTVQSHLGTEIADLQRIGENYARRIAKKDMELKKLDEQIANMEKKLKEQRISQKKKNQEKEGGLESTEDIKRKIKALENQLDKQRQKYNQAIAHNRQLRDQIDALRRERVVFDKIYQNLEKELERKKVDMVDLIKEAEKAYVQRKFAELQIADLKKHSEKEKKDFEEQWEEIENLIKENQQVKDYIKNQEETKMIQFETDGSENLNILRNEEKDLRQRVDESTRKVNEYSTALQKIKTETGLANIDDLVQAFEKAEEDNQSLFNYVTELDTEIDNLRKKISDTQIEIAKYKGQGITIDSQRRQLVEELEGKIADAEEKTKQYKSKYDDTLKTINALKIGIKNIYDSIGCEDEDEHQESGYQGVTESNMMHFLSVIERRTNEILQMYSICQSKGGGFENLNLGGGAADSKPEEINGKGPHDKILSNITAPKINEDAWGFELDFSTLQSKKLLREIIKSHMEEEEKDKAKRKDN